MRKIEGRNPVIEALNSGVEIDVIYINKESCEGVVSKIAKLAKDKNIRSEELV